MRRLYAALLLEPVLVLLPELVLESQLESLVGTTCPLGRRGAMTLRVKGIRLPYWTVVIRPHRCTLCESTYMIFWTTFIFEMVTFCHDNKVDLSSGGNNTALNDYLFPFLFLPP
jgi:hypothetical protein